MMTRWNVVIAATAMAAGAAQAQVNWVPPAGAGSFFTYTGGLSDNGLFGNPLLVGDSFFFTPASFVANSVNGVAHSVVDRIQVDLTANPGHRFTSIKVTEFGNWTITGIGTVQATGELRLIDMLVPRLATDALSTTPAMPVSAPATGLWSGVAEIDLTAIAGADWTKLRLVFANTLHATSGAGSAATIRKTAVAGPAIVVDILPAPGGAVALGFGLLFASRRRRA